MAEIWRDIVDFEGEYQVSNMGRVRSLPGGHRHAKVLKPGLSGREGNQYLIVGLRGRITKAVHRLVAVAFMGPPPVGKEVCHNNGDRLDNRLANLRYGTRSENMKDSVMHGTNVLAARTHCKNGHEYAEANTRQEKTRRICRTCENAYDRAERARKRAAKAA